MRRSDAEGDGLPESGLRGVEQGRNHLEWQGAGVSRGGAGRNQVRRVARGAVLLVGSTARGVERGSGV